MRARIDTDIDAKIGFARNGLGTVLRGRWMRAYSPTSG